MISEKYSFFNPTCLNKTWSGRISVVQRKDLRLLYFCPAKLFSSLTFVCHRLWEWSVCACLCLCTCVSGHSQHCAFNCPSTEQPHVALLIVQICSCVDLFSSRTEESNWKSKKTLRRRSRNSGQDVDHHANSHVCDGQSRRIGKMIRMIDWIQIRIEIEIQFIIIMGD